MPTARYREIERSNIPLISREKTRNAVGGTSALKRSRSPPRSFNQLNKNRDWLRDGHGYVITLHMDPRQFRSSSKNVCASSRFSYGASLCVRPVLPLTSNPLTHSGARLPHIATRVRANARTCLPPCCSPSIIFTNPCTILPFSTHDTPQETHLSASIVACPHFFCPALYFELLMRERLMLGRLNRFRIRTSINVRFPSSFQP